LIYFLMYSLGAVVGIGVAWLLKLTILRGPTPPFVLELPTYKWPGPSVVLHRMLEQGGAFVYRAGTLILLVQVIVWALAYYPRDPGSQAPGVLDREVALSAEVETLAADYAKLAATVPNKELEEDGSPKALELKGSWSALSAKQAELADVQNHIAGTYLEKSYLGQMGKAIEPAVKPLGWDWKLGAAAIASFPAREVIVATLGTIYNLGDAEDEESQPLREQLREATWAGTERKVYNVPVALSVMVFFALCAQCASTLAIMKRETGSYWWPLFTFIYMTTLAYIGAFIAYQGGTWLGW
jgi:ferrous iron transport protein B